jgi:hypothetical protein
MSITDNFKEITEPAHAEFGLSTPVDKAGDNFFNLLYKFQRLSW